MGFIKCMKGTCCWHEGLFLTEGEIWMFAMYLLYFDGELDCMRVFVCGYAHTHTHTHVGYLHVSPGVGTRHLESPKNPDRLNLSIYICRICVQNIHVYICMLGSGMKCELAVFSF